MAVAANLKTFLSNSHVRRQYVLWKVTRVLTGRAPRISLPRGEQLDPASRFNDYVALRTQHPELGELKLFDELLPQDSVFVDVGANIGAMTVLAHSTGKTRRILAFEPAHRYCGVWHRNMELNHVSGATLLQVALSDSAAEVRFRVDTAMPLHGKLDIGKMYASSSVETVTAVRLDQVCSIIAVDKIDLLKVDVEGAEPKVIRGAGKLLSERRISTMLLEFIVEHMEDMGEDPQEFVHLLVDAGYELRAIQPDGSLGEVLNAKSIVDERRVSPGDPQRPFWAINVVAVARL